MLKRNVKTTLTNLENMGYRIVLFSCEYKKKDDVIRNKMKMVLNSLEIEDIQIYYNIYNKKGEAKKPIEFYTLMIENGNNNVALDRDESFYVGEEEEVFAKALNLHYYENKDFFTDDNKRKLLDYLKTITAKEGEGWKKEKKSKISLVDIVSTRSEKPVNEFKGT